MTTTQLLTLFAIVLMIIGLLLIVDVIRKQISKKTKKDSKKIDDNDIAKILDEDSVNAGAIPTVKSPKLSDESPENYNDSMGLEGSELNPGFNHDYDLPPVAITASTIDEGSVQLSEHMMVSTEQSNAEQNDLVTSEDMFANLEQELDVNSVTENGFEASVDVDNQSDYTAADVKETVIAADMDENDIVIDDEPKIHYTAGGRSSLYANEKDSNNFEDGVYENRNFENDSFENNGFESNSFENNVDHDVAVATADTFVQNYNEALDADAYTHDLGSNELDNFIVDDLNPDELAGANVTSEFSHTDTDYTQEATTVNEEVIDQNIVEDEIINNNNFVQDTTVDQLTENSSVEDFVLEEYVNQDSLHEDSIYQETSVDTNVLQKQGGAQDIDLHAYDEASPILDNHLQLSDEQDQNSPLTNAKDNLNISILPNNEFSYISGAKLLELVDSFGFKFGAMNMFHRYQNKNGSGLLWFSMMGLTKDGIVPFDLNTLPTTMELKGLVLFLPLPHPKVLQGFDSMMSIAGLIAREVDGFIVDDEGNEMSIEYKKKTRAVLQSTFGEQK